MHRIASYRISKNLWNRYTRFLAALGGGFFIICLFSSDATAQNLNIAVDTVLNSGTYTYSDVAVTNGAKLILNGNVTLSANNVTVDSGAAITADGKGHSGGQGPGAGVWEITGGSGGGYGGTGGTTPVLPDQFGGIYGSAVRPVDLGSGGGGLGCSTPAGSAHSGGPGGGSVRLEISGVLTVNGSITSNGNGPVLLCSSHIKSGGGSGGSIYVIADSIAGGGSMSAKGGQGGPSRGGGGGGGRIAVYYKNWNFLGTINASGGFGLTELGVSATGKNGTVGLFDVVNNDFYAGPSWRFQENDSPFELNKVTLNGSVVETEKNISVSAADMILNNGSVLLANEEASFSVQDISVLGNSIIEGNLKINAVNFFLAQGSKVSADAKGHLGGQGLGAGLASQFGGSGGGYGGRGGAGGLVSSGGLPYGSPTAPVDFGSGGGGPGGTVNNVVFPSSGGPGGGKIQLTVANTLTVDGVISANGGNALARQSGGGAGGSIYIITEKFSGSGSFMAAGGQSGPTAGAAAGGGGGGGRVAIFHRQPSTFAGSITSLGGLGVGHNGENGSVITVQNQLAVYPGKGGDTGSVTVTISGSVFVDGSTAKLARNGQSDIVGDSLKLSDNGTKLTATFNLAGQARGEWDLVMTHPDGSTVSLSNGFTIEEGRAPELWVDVIGLNQIRAGRQQKYWVAYGNKGNTDVPVAHMLLGISGTGQQQFGENADFIPMSGDTGYHLMTFNAQAGDTFVQPLNIVATSPLHIDYGITHDASKFANLHFRILPNDGSLAQNQLTSLNAQGVQSNAAQNSAYPPYFGPYEPAPAGYVYLFMLSDGSYESAISLGNGRIRWSFPGLGGVVDTTIDEIVQTNPEVLGAFGSWRPTRDWGIDPVTGELIDPNVLSAEVDQKTSHFLGRAFCNPSFDGNCVDLEGNPILNPDRTPKTGTSCVDFVTDSLKEILNMPDFLGDVKSVDNINLLFELAKLNAGSDNLIQTVITFYKIFVLNKSIFLTKIGISLAQAIDPNDKVGPQGIGQLRFVSGKEPLHYATFFENAETANAPAQEVVITDQLDPDKMNLITFSLGPVAFGDKSVIPPAGSKEYITEVDLRPGNNLIVRIEARLDMATGIATWQFLSLDPQTKRFTSDPLAGFLPPNVNPPEGDGSVVFTVMPKEGLLTGTSILNKAAIVFDVNAPIETPEWFNLVDNTQPQSAVNPLPFTQEHRNFEVSWTGTDEGAGTRDYTVFVSEDNGPFTVWQENTANTSAIFTGEDGKTYAFYSVARDLVGNIEDASLFGDTATKVSANTAPQAVDDSYDITEDGSLVIPSEQGVLANDIDNEHNPLTAALVDGAAHGTLTLNSDGSFNYQPSANFFGMDSFTYKANDGALDSNVATVMIQVNPVNDAPQADAGEDQTVECRHCAGTMVVLDGSASSDIEGDSLTYTWTGPFSEGNVTVTGVDPAITLPLGTHTVVLTVDDSNGGTGTDEVKITIEDTMPPDVTAQWDPLKYKGDEKVFRVEFSAEDICDTQPQVTGVIEMPSLDGLEVKLKRGHEMKIKFDLSKRMVEIQGPDLNALLNQLQTYGGIVVRNGQKIKIDLEDNPKDKKQEYEVDDGWLKIKAPSAVLRVMSVDSSGNSAEKRVSPDIRDDRDHDHGKRD